MKGKMADALERAKGGLVEGAPEATDVAAQTGPIDGAPEATPKTDTPVAEMTQVDPNSASLADVVQASDAAPEVKKTFATQLLQQRDDAPEIAQAFEDIGGKATEGSLSRQKAVREFESTVVNDPGLVVGQGVRDQHAANWRAVSNAASDAISTGEEAGASKYATGDQIKDSIIAKTEAEKAGTSALYDELGMTAKEIPVRDTGIKRIGQNILKIPEIEQGMVDGAPKSSSARLASGIVDRLSNVKTLSDLDIQIKLIGEDLGLASTKGEQRIAGIIKEKLNNFYDTILDEQFSKSDRNDLIALRKEAKGRFAAMMGDLKELGSVAGKKNVGSPGAFIDFMRSIPSEKLADKLFADNNPKFLKFLSEKYPDEFKALVNLEKRQIMEKATVDGQVMPAKVFTAVSKYSPEVQQIILGEKAPLYASAKKAFESMPTQINPSGTARMQAYREAFTVGGAVKNLAAGAKLAAMKSPHALIYVEQAMKSAAEKLDMIPQAIDSMSRSTGAPAGVASLGAISRLADGSKDRHAAFKKISEEITSSAGDPDKMANRVSNATTPFQQGGAPNIADAFNGKLTNAMQYLNAQLPKPLTPPNPLIKQDFKPSDAAISAFERKLHTIMDPFSAIDDMKNGSLTSDQVQALQSVYPKLYEQMQTRIINHISSNEKTVPYGARLKLSLMMGAPLDPSLSPQSIQAYQSTYAQEEAAEKAKPQDLKLGVADRTAPNAKL